MVAAVTLAIGAMLAPPEAKAQTTPTKIENALTNGTTVVIGAQAESNIVASTAVEIDLWQETGLGIQARIASTNASTATVGIKWVFTLDGTNYLTDRPFWQITSLNGTTAVNTGTNLPSQYLDNFKKAKIAAITNGHTASLFVTNVLTAKHY